MVLGNVTFSTIMGVWYGLINSKLKTWILDLHAFPTKAHVMVHSYTALVGSLNFSRTLHGISFKAQTVQQGSMHAVLFGLS